MHGGNASLPMAVLSLSNAHLAFGHVALLDNAAFSLEAGERLGLIVDGACRQAAICLPRA